MSEDIPEPVKEHFTEDIDIKIKEKKRAKKKLTKEIKMLGLVKKSIIEDNE